MRLDYDGGEVRSPEPLTWRQVAPALPKAGHGARIVASEISEGWMRDTFDDPLHSLLASFGMAQMRRDGKSVGPGRIRVGQNHPWNGGEETG